ncbi:MAG: DUF72 domain-containing protein [Cyanobacteria bacterium J06648_16]
MFFPFYLGCAVWAYKDWVGPFYPKGSRPGDFLKLYAERLTTVEGNTTFYSVPSAEMVQRWAAMTPASFRFCPKLPRAATHEGALMPHLDEVLTFVDLMKGLGDRLGPIFAQLPPSYSPTSFTDLAEFCTSWPHRDVPLAVEVRHLDWFKPDVALRLNALLTRLRVGRVLLDTRLMYATGEPDPQFYSERRKPKVPLQPAVTAPFSMVRYIGHPDLPKNEAPLQNWAVQVKDWLAQGTTVYFFVHCPNESVSPAIARRLHTLLTQAGAAIPPLPWDAVTEPQQLGLF